MDLQPYLVVTATNPVELQAKCKETLEYEEIDEGFVFYYMPMGAPIAYKDEDGFVVLLQSFIVSSHPEGDEDEFTIPTNNYPLN